MNPLNQSKNATILPVLIALTLGCFALSPQARAVCQEGCLTNENTVLGDDALGSNTTGSSNTATGSGALQSSTIGSENTANGFDALSHNTTGYANTAIGVNSLGANTVGHSNTAIGWWALSQNTAAGRDNTATGKASLYLNTTGYRNTANGESALFENVSGTNNTAIGYSALYSNTGSSNVALGVNAGVQLTTGNGNVCLGAFVSGVAGESNTTRIRNVYSSVAADRAVYVTADNKIGTLVSSRRFKEEIKPMDKASEAILALKPVTFRYKKEIESNGSIMFGLIAEDVEKADPDLVTRDEKGQAETVRYEAVNAMLLNESLKEHRKVEEQEATIAQLKKGMDVLTARLDEQDSKIQKVTRLRRVEMSRPVPQMVGNNQ
jgi:hypothetical protein